MSDTPPTLNRPARTNLFRKPLFWIVSIALSGIALISISLVVLYIRIAPNFDDLPEPPDDSALLVIRDEIPDEENAYHFFVEAVNHSFITGPQLRRYQETIREDIWDEELVREILQSNAQAIEFVKQGAQRSRALPPLEETLEDKRVYDHERSEDLDKVLYLYPRLLAAQGRESDGIDFCMEQAKFANTLMHSNGTIWDYYVGTAMQKEAFDSLLNLIKISDLESETYRSLQAAVARLGDAGDALSKSLKTEYAVMIRALEDVVEEMLRMDRNEWPASRRAKWRYQPNRVKKLFVDDFLLQLQNANKPSSATSVRGPNEYGVPSVFEMFKPNYYGKLATASILPGVHIGHSGKCRANSITSATQTLLALKAFEKTTGALPESLDSLLPSYFETIPLDDFDGEPIRYDSTRRIIYSIGRDLMDDGGDEKKDIVWSLGEP